MVLEHKNSNKQFFLFFSYLCASMAIDASATNPPPEISSTTPTLITINVNSITNKAHTHKLSILVSPIQCPSLWVWSHRLCWWLQHLPINHPNSASQSMDPTRSTSSCDSCFCLTIGHLPYCLYQNIQRGLGQASSSLCQQSPCTCS